jgi:hypothetical protein
MGDMMDFLETLFERHDGRHSHRHNDHGRHSSRSWWDTPHGDPRDAHVSEREDGTPRASRDDPHGRSVLPGILDALAQRKTLVVVGALMLLVVAIGGVVALVMLLPMAGSLFAGVGAQDLFTRLTDLPRLITMLLVDVPKAVLDYLAPLLQLKSTLEGKA